MKKLLKKAAGAAKNIADGTAEKLKEMSIKVAAENMLTKLKRDKIPVYIIHTGENSNDFKVIMDFEAYQKSLSEQKLTVPIISPCYVGRDDIDKNFLAEQIVETYNRDLEKIKANLRKKVVTSNDAISEKKKELFESSLGNITNSGFLVLFLLLPGVGTLTSIILTLVGIGGIAAVAEDMTEFIKLQIKTIGKTPDESELKEIEKQVEKNKARLVKGLKDIEISIHSELKAQATVWMTDTDLPGTDVADESLPPLPESIRTAMYT